MKRVLFMVLLAITTTVFISGCQTGLDTSPAAPTDMAVDELDRQGGFFTRVTTTLEPFDCEMTVSWVTSLDTDDNYLYYGNSSGSLTYLAQAPDGGTNHSVVIDATDLELTWYMQLSGKPFVNMPPVYSDEYMKKRYPCLGE